MGKTIFQAVTFIIFFVIANQATAQIIKPSVTLGVNLLGASAKGSFKDEYNMGGGGEVFGGVGLGRTFIIGTAGFSAFKARSGNNSGVLTYIPLKIGLKQYVFRKLIFINGDLGIATVKNKNFKESRFTRGIGAGVKLLGLEVALYYDGWKNINSNAKGFQNAAFGKLGYSFTL